MCVLGGGSWGTAIADLISHNVNKFPEYFTPEVFLYLRDSNLCQLIELKRENVKYLPTIRLHQNVKPISSLEETLAFADIVLFAIPHEYVEDVCFQINDYVLTKRPIGISLTKGVYSIGGELERITQRIERITAIPMGVLSGANVAIEVAQRQYCEATLCPPNTGREMEHILSSLFESSFFHVTFSNDQPTVEICAALKNVIACGAGLIDGLGFGINTKSAAIACGFRELHTFVAHFHADFERETLLQACGIGDVIASSFGGRNRKVAEAFARTNKSLADLEQELLKGQKLQGPSTSRSVFEILTKHNLVQHFPFFTTVHRIFEQTCQPIEIINAIRSH